MSDDTLKHTVENLKQNTKTEIKLPSGDSVEIRTNGATVQSSGSRDQLKEFQKFPTIDLSEPDEDRSDQE